MGEALLFDTECVLHILLSSARRFEVFFDRVVLRRESLQCARRVRTVAYRESQLSCFSETRSHAIISYTRACCALLTTATTQ